MKIVPLGINGFVPTFGRHTTSFLVLTDDEAILLDAGTGVARLFEKQVAQLLTPYPRLHVILSHYHLDHVVGLAYLAGAPSAKPVFIHAPAPPLVDGDPLDSLHSLLSPPFFSLPLDQFPMGVRVVPITGEQFAIGRSVVSVRRQIHPGGSIGVRLGDLVFMTDTAVDGSAVSFMRRAKLLLHEVWLRDEDVPEHKRELDGHSFLSGVTGLATEAEVSDLMPIHMHPERSDDEIARFATGLERQGLRILLPIEGRVYEIP
jgi:ribonuclease BN (tRNA processing enzyme)